MTKTKAVGSFSYPLTQKTAFLFDYGLQKVLLTLFHVKKDKLKLWLVELAYMASKVLPQSSTFHAHNNITDIETKYGKFGIRANTFDVICALPSFEHRDVKRLINSISREISDNKKVLFLDVGADFGTYSITIGNAFKQTDNLTISAFEPSDSSYRLLRSNLGLNNLHSVVTTYKYALSDKIQKLNYYFDIDSPGSSGLNKGLVTQTAKPEVTNATTLDKILEKKIKDYDVIFVKMDVEGWETKILKGGNCLFDKTKTYFLVEDFVDDAIVEFLTNKASFINKLTPYNSWWVYEPEET